MKETTTITVSRDTHKQLSLYKINSTAKNLDSIISALIEKLKGEISPVNSDDASIKPYGRTYSKEVNNG